MLENKHSQNQIEEILIQEIQPNKEKQKKPASKIKKIRKKLKGKKRIITLTGLVTISGILNTPQPIRTSTDVEHNQFNSEIENETQIKINALKEYIHLKNPRMPLGEDERLVLAILRESKNLKLPENATIFNKKADPFIFLVALIETESTFNKYAISKANARGYVQIMPQTALWIKEKQMVNFSLSELHSTEINVMLGVRYLNYLSTQFYDIKRICLAYNAGDGNVRRGYYDIRYWIKIQRFYKEFETFLENYKKTLNTPTNI
ncbi:MAG: hypothetical protein KatS3mg129_0576 [Leptospiraceae bacterium]|nr:MAG: hypothetical protein KatS3mg129_0576 [Leptospiraceae bacterium]